MLTGDIYNLESDKLANGNDKLGLLYANNVNHLVEYKTNLNGLITEIDLCTMIKSDTYKNRGYLIIHNPTSEFMLES